MNTDEMAASRRADPNYVQISGHVPKPLALEFKLAFTRAEINQSEAMEAAIALWVQQQEGGKA
ncbi:MULTISPECIES: hypothetical protein [Cyanophyceae]|uniref:Uncharacterized protein n=1 Tax=Leptolyngbya subtilissima DQ-A4 TaxID=2933933 RepID=A0ABV0KC00_9CYAN|nr:hypothetical protein [Nodosilinea sp. FACHB-141]MBD2115244.1 hypothetical protein [Nodosilinea sp. FACHB-141]